MKLNLPLFFSLCLLLCFACQPTLTDVSDTMLSTSVSDLAPNATYALFAAATTPPDHGAQVKSADYLTLNEAELQRLYTEAPERLVFSIPNQQGVPEVYFFHKTTATTDNFILLDQQGKQHRVQPGLHYREIRHGERLAALSVFPDHLSGVIGTAVGNFNLSQLKKRPSTYILYNERNLTEPPEAFSCGAVLPEDYRAPTAEDYAAQLHRNPNDPVVRVFLEADYDLYVREGESIQAVYEYVTTLMHFTATVYEVDDIILQTSEILVWTGPDPYSTNRDQALSTFVQRWQAVGNTFNGDVS